MKQRTVDCVLGLLFLVMLLYSAYWLYTCLTVWNGLDAIYAGTSRLLFTLKAALHYSLGLVVVLMFLANRSAVKWALLVFMIWVWVIAPGWLLAPDDPAFLEAVRVMQEQRISTPPVYSATIAAAVSLYYAVPLDPLFGLVCLLYAFILRPAMLAARDGSDPIAAPLRAGMVTAATRNNLIILLIICIYFANYVVKLRELALVTFVYGSGYTGELPGIWLEESPIAVLFVSIGLGYHLFGGPARSPWWVLFFGVCGVVLHWWKIGSGWFFPESTILDRVVWYSRYFVSLTSAFAGYGLGSVLFRYQDRPAMVRVVAMVRRWRQGLDARIEGGSKVPIAVVVVLAGWVISSGWYICHRLELEKLEMGRNQIWLLADGVEKYYQNSGKLPATLASLPKSHHGGNLWVVREGHPLDPWGNDYEYSIYGDTYYVIRASCRPGEKDGWVLERDSRYTGVVSIGGGESRTQRIDRTRGEIQSLADEVNRYRQGQGRLPGSLSELPAVRSSARWLMLRDGVPVDLWWRPYAYEISSDTEFVISSVHTEDSALWRVAYDSRQGRATAAWEPNPGDEIQPIGTVRQKRP